MTGPARRSRRGGFALLPVTLALAVLGAVAWMLAREAAVEVATVEHAADADAARFVAEAGYHHARWLVAATGCSGTPSLPPTPFGPHSYSATFTPDGPDALRITAVGTLAGGTSRTVSRGGISATATPQVLVIQPGPAQGEDAYLNDNLSLANFGTDPRLSVSNKTNAKDRGLVRFDLSSVPAGAAVQSATLELYLEDIGSANAGTVSVHRVTGDWTEAGVSWIRRDGTNNWNVAGGDHDPAAAATAPVDWTQPGPVTWDVTALVAGWLAGTWVNHGVLLRASAGLNNVHLSTSDSPTPAQRPKLTVTFACACGVPCSAGIYLDRFGSFTCNLADYAGSDGDLDWTPTPWTEIGEGGDPCTGGVRLEQAGSNSHLRISADGKGVERAADLSSFTTARLSFGYRRTELEAGDFLRVEAWDTATAGWVEIGRVEGPGDDGDFQLAEFDLTPYVSPATRIRVMAQNFGGGVDVDEILIDDVQIDRQDLAGGGGGGPGGPVTLSLPVVEDARIDESSPTTAYGTDDTWSVGRDGSNNDRRGLLRFDLSALPATATVTSATVRFYVTGGWSNKSVPVGAFRLTAPFDETVDTWASTGGGAADPTLLGQADLVPAVGWAGVPIDPAVIHEWRDGVVPNHGLLLQPVSGARKNRWLDPASHEHPTVAWHPELVVEYVLP